MKLPSTKKLKIESLFKKYKHRDCLHRSGDIKGKYKEKRKKYPLTTEKVKKTLINDSLVK